MKKLIIPLLVILILPLIFQSTLTEIIKLRTFDKLVQTYEPSGNFMILNITDDDLQREGGWPLPRERLAEIQLEILGKGAMGVGWVISLPQADRMNGDSAFARSLGYAPSILATFENGKGIYPKTTGTVIKGPNVGGIQSTGIQTNYSAYDKVTQGVAIAPTEVDQLVRRIPLMLKTPTGWSASFGTQVLKSLTNTPTYIVTTNINGIQEIAVRGLPPIKTDILGRKWISWVDTEQTNLQEMNVNGKFVFIGVTASGVMPQIATPVGLLEPHKIQAALSESILIQDSPYIPDFALGLELIIFVLSVSLIWLILIRLGITYGIVLGILTMALTGGVGAYLITRSLLIDVSWSLISQFIVGSVAFYIRFREQYKLRQQIKKQFQHYLDPRQVKKLQDNPELLKLGGQKKYCTFLFTDVRGFTALSESLEPEQVTYIMNKALTAQQNAVQKHQGMVDKYIGDAMMAIFNAPIDIEKHEEKALLCALDIQNNMRLLNKELKEQGISPVQIGIGINTGYAVVGNMGSDTRFDYTAIGDAVNVAARLESGTKNAGVDLLIGQTTENALEFDLIPLEPIEAKGKKEKLQVYTWH